LRRFLNFFFFGFFLLGVMPVKAMLASPADSTVSTDKILAGTFANDATFRTDYYFTQGMRLKLVHPVLQKSPVNKILLQAGTGATRYHGLQIRYDGFTPLKILETGIRYGDRPYAAYIYAKNYVVNNYPAKKQRLTSGLDLGFIGPGAGAKEFQIKVHEWLDSPRPLGWDNQLRTDLILGYTADYEKQLLGLGKVVEVMGNAGASVGSLYTHATGGLFTRIGKMNPYFHNLGITARENRSGLQKFQFYAQGGLTGKLVGYNATLQGGLLNQDNPHTLSGTQISRTVHQKTAGLVGTYGGISFESSIVWISPEFKNARPHKWMHFELQFML
jgi:lipid A 3-O-deacylase